MQPSSQWDICTTRGNNLKTSFPYMSQNVKKYIYFGLFRGPRGGGGSSMIRLGLSCFPAILSPYLCTFQIMKQSDKKFLNLNPKYEKNILFFIFGGSLGVPMSNPGERKFAFLAIRGPINNRTGPILLPRHPLTYINLHIKYGSNPIRIF